MGPFSRQLGRDVPVTPVPLAALHSLARWRRGLTGHLPLLVDLEAAFLVDVEAIIYAQRGKALLAFTVVLVPTGEAFTHTHVKSGVYLGLLVCRVGRERKTKITVWVVTPLGESHSLSKTNANALTEQKTVRWSITTGHDLTSLIWPTPNNNHLSRYECVSVSWVHFYILLGWRTVIICCRLLKMDFSHCGFQGIFGLVGSHIPVLESECFYQSIMLIAFIFCRRGS